MFNYLKYSQVVGSCWSYLGRKKMMRKINNFKLLKTF